MQVPLPFLIPVIKSLSLDSTAIGLFLAPFNLTQQDIFNVDGKIEAGIFDSIVQKSVAISGNPAIGLSQGILVDLRQLGLVAWIMMNSGTLGVALKNFQHYNTIVCSGINYLTILRDNVLIVRFVSSDVNRKLYRALMDSVVLSFHRIIKQLIDEPAQLKYLSLGHPDSGEASAYFKLFGLVPRFDQEFYEIHYEPTLLESSVKFSDANLLQHFTHKADLLMGKAAPESIELRVRKLVLDHLNGTSLRLVECAQELAMSTRSLQAHLKNSGTSFKNIVETIHKEFALNELSVSDMSITEIAWLLGYSEISSFYTVFKKWTGKTPLQVRKQLHNGE